MYETTTVFADISGEHFSGHHHDGEIQNIAEEISSILNDTYDIKNHITNPCNYGVAEFELDTADLNRHKLISPTLFSNEITEMEGMYVHCNGGEHSEVTYTIYIEWEFMTNDE